MQCPLIRGFVTVGLSACAIGLVACGRPAAPTPTTAPDFVTEVKPILEANCVGCHYSGSLLGHLNLESAKTAFAAGPNGALIVPGQPEASRLLTVLDLDRADANAMPPERHALPENQRETIRQWIAGGAVWPDGPDGRLTVVTTTDPES